jgi:hypothetical protein
LFKKKFLYYLKKAYKDNKLKFAGKQNSLCCDREFYKLLSELYEKKWITYCKRPFGGAKQVIDYLGRYTHRVAITNSRLKEMKDGKVVFGYKDYRDGKNKEMEVTAVEFIRRFMLHILPEGFFKIRYYGILSSKKKKAALEKCFKILFKKKKVKEREIIQEIRRLKICPKCREKEKREKLRMASG